MQRHLVLFAAILAAPAAQAANPGLEQQFAQTVRPFVTKYCADCHSGDAPAAQFDLQSELRQQVIDWIKAMRSEEARKNAGDPGVVLARRLSNAEYNYTVRDLTGVDIRPTREFPVDPANPEGFDNSGESLTMSPALRNNYLQAAREVGDHMVLTPDGFDFAPHPMLVETDRDRYAIQRTVNQWDLTPTWRFGALRRLPRPDTMCQMRYSSGMATHLTTVNISLTHNWMSSCKGA